MAFFSPSKQMLKKNFKADLNSFLGIFLTVHMQGPREPGGTDTEWDTSAFGLC
jgi:hypothetical protein